MLEIKDATKSYGNALALDRVSLSLNLGQTHVLLGSSGSGKSTLLRAILGLVELNSGSIFLNGHSVSQMPAFHRAAKLGYVPQDAGLFPHLTAEANITLIARSLLWSRSKMNDRLQELNTIVSLDEILFDRFPHQLSGGQKQRVALLRSLFLNPDLVLMDEPFAALDPLVRAELQSEVKALFSQLKKTVVFVTHDVGEADFLADNIVLMHEGRIVQQGQLKDLIELPANPFVTKFLRAQRVHLFEAAK